MCDRRPITILPILAVIVHAIATCRAQTCGTEIHKKTFSHNTGCTGKFDVVRRICSNGGTIQTVRSMDFGCYGCNGWFCSLSGSLGSCTGTCTSTRVNVRTSCTNLVNTVNCNFAHTIKNCDTLTWGAWALTTTCTATGNTAERHQRPCHQCDGDTVASGYCDGSATRELICNGSWSSWAPYRGCMYVKPSCTPNVEYRRRCMFEDGTETVDISRCESTAPIRFESCELPSDCPTEWSSWTSVGTCSFVNSSCTPQLNYTRQCVHYNGTLAAHYSQCSNERDKLEDCELANASCPASWSTWSPVTNCTYARNSCAPTANYSRSCRFLNGTEAGNSSACSNDSSEKLDSCVSGDSCPAEWSAWAVTRNCSHVYPSCAPTTTEARTCIQWDGTEGGENDSCSDQPSLRTQNCTLVYSCCGCSDVESCPLCHSSYLPLPTTTTVVSETSQTSAEASEGFRAPDTSSTTSETGYGATLASVRVETGTDTATAIESITSLNSAATAGSITNPDSAATAGSITNPDSAATVESETKPGAASVLESKTATDATEENETITIAESSFTTAPSNNISTIGAIVAFISSAVGLDRTTTQRIRTRTELTTPQLGAVLNQAAAQNAFDAQADSDTSSTIVGAIIAGATVCLLGLVFGLVAYARYKSRKKVSQDAQTFSGILEKNTDSSVTATEDS